jgi:hypothetical protein
MTSLYAAEIQRLAPIADPAHVEAWMRLKHGMLDSLNAAHFAREVQLAVGCIEFAGLNESDELARSYGLQPRVRYNVGDRVLVARDPGLEPAEAKIAALSNDRPHVVKIVYVRSRTGAWIAQKRIIGRAEAS